MHPDAHKLLWDAHRAAGRVAAFASGKSFEQYQADVLLRSAVERQLEVVCSRNVLVHADASVDDRIVWDIVRTRLGPLLAALDALLAPP